MEKCPTLRSKLPKVGVSNIEILFDPASERMQGSNFFSVLNDFRLERLSYSAEIVPIVLPNEACPDYGKKERKKGKTSC